MDFPLYIRPNDHFNEDIAGLIYPLVTWYTDAFEFEDTLCVERLENTQKLLVTDSRRVMVVLSKEELYAMLVGFEILEE